MLYATNRFPGDGITTKYEISFVGGYLNRTHVKAYIIDAAGLTTTVPLRDGNFLNTNTLYNLPTTPVGSTFVIYRDTPRTPLVDFVAGSRLTEANLDTASRQGLFISMEALDAGSLLTPLPTGGVATLQNAGIGTGLYIGANAGTALLRSVAAGPNVALDVVADTLVISAVLPEASASLVGFQQEGTGAVSTTVQSKLRESVSVKDFGAVGDGFTDDTAALQAAINYAANLSVGGTASGCVLDVPPGEYAISTTLVMPVNLPFTLRGAGQGASKLRRLSGDGPVIACRSASIIEGLFFKGPVAGSSLGIYCDGANTATIKENWFQNQILGIRLTSSYAVEIRSNIFDVCYSYGVVATTSAHNTMLELNNFFTCGVLNSGQAVRFDVASNNLGIINNDFEHCFVNIALAACTSVQITGNYMEYHKAACFDFGNSCSDVVIESNWIALGDVAGGGFISSVQNITGGRFSHNTVYNQTINFIETKLVGFDVWMNTKTGTGTLGKTPWINPTMLNGWAQQANFTQIGYIKDSRGWVHLRGGVYWGAAPNTMFNLPAAYRPAAIGVFSTESVNGPCRITVNTNGDVVPTIAASNNPSLDGISFYVG